MRVELTALHHNCFVLRCARRALLFDWPAPKHQPPGVVEALARAVRGARRLTVFASHGHQDHFDPQTAPLLDFLFPDLDVAYVLSDDIAELLPESLPHGGSARTACRPESAAGETADDAHPEAAPVAGAPDAAALDDHDGPIWPRGCPCAGFAARAGVASADGDAGEEGEVGDADCCTPELLVVEPDASYVFAGLRIHTFLSNDLGVAFLLAVPTAEGPLLVWHGGDLACWDWPSGGKAARMFNHQFFEAAQNRMRAAARDLAPSAGDAARPHVAFQNCDPRLPDMAGGPRFLSRIAPRVFAPMHAFGDLDFVRSLDALLAPERPAGTRLFLYDRVGATEAFDFEL